MSLILPLAPTCHNGFDFTPCACAVSALSAAACLSPKLQLHTNSAATISKEADPFSLPISDSTSSSSS